MKKLTGKLILEDRIIPNGEIIINGESVEYAGERRRDGSVEVVSFGDLYLSPGFVDIHVHGGGGADFLDGTVEAFHTAARLHGSHGTTAMLPTTLTCPDDELFAAFDLFREAASADHCGSDLCGLHLEGPYFSASQKGAQDERYLRVPTPEHYNGILRAGEGIIRRWTVAPELDGAMELGRVLQDEGILASMGHSNAEYECVLEGSKNGYTLLTHFYSGMSSMVRRGGFRYPGMIEAGYIIENMNVEVIADGCHLPYSMLGMVYRIKGADRTCLITDAMRGAGQTEGTTVLGSLKNGQTVFIEDGVAKMPDRTAFAGSIATADRLVRCAYRGAGIPLCDAVKMMTATPASLAGLSRKGRLLPGYDADIVVFDGDINVKSVFVRGKEIYHA